MPSDGQGNSAVGRHFHPLRKQSELWQLLRRHDDNGALSTLGDWVKEVARLCSQFDKGQLADRIDIDVYKRQVTKSWGDLIVA